MGQTKFDANLETGELVIERVFDAPREKVWRAWSDNDAIKQWWGPRTFPTTHSDMDFRVGGRWHYCMTGPDGTEAWGLIKYVEIDEPARIVYTDVFSDKEGNENMELPSMTTTMTFEDVDGKTRMVSRGKYPKGEDLKKVMEMGMEQGFEETMDKLDEYLAKK